jgi:transcriptional regulator with XRE-family HTH domain
VSTSSGAPDIARANDDLRIGVALGRAIRAARTERKLSMRTLATAAEISQPFLSQIEGGQTMPSVVTLFRIAGALEISPSALLPSVAEPEPIFLSRADGPRVRVDEGDDDAASRVISSGSARNATVQEYRIERGPYEGTWFESDGEITVYVVEGEITVTIDGHGDWALSAGDSLWYPGSLRNRWTMPEGADPATVLLVYANPA